MTEKEWELSVNDAEAGMRYVTARGYWLACDMIFSNPQREGREVATILPLQMLAGFALELYFKAWLLKTGCETKAVRKSGHDIARQYRWCKRKGLPTIPGLDEMVEVVSGPHSDFTYRYLSQTDRLTVLGWLSATSVLAALDKAVDTFLGASASFGLEPGH